MKILMLLLLLCFYSCSLLGPSPHDSMSKRLRSYIYSKPLNELKEGIKKGVIKQNSLTESRMISLSSTVSAHNRAKSEISAEEAMQDGFTYKHKLYRSKTLDIELGDFFAANTASRLKSKLNEVIETGDIHLLEDDADKMILVNGGRIITASKVTENQTKIETCILISYQRGPLDIGFSLSKFAANGFNPLKALNISKGPVILEESLKYCNRDRAMELSLFYELEPELAQKWEKDK